MSQWLHGGRSFKMVVFLWHCQVELYSEIPMIDLTWSFQSTLQICPPPRCAGWARNPKGPQITPFCHQMDRHPTIWDFKTGIQHRIPAWILPWGSRGLNPNFFSLILEQHMPKSTFSARVLKLLAPIAMDLGPQGPKGPTGGPREPWAPCSESADLLG